MPGSSWLRNVLVCSALGLLGIGCRTPGPPTAPEDENIEEQAMRTEMMEHRGRLELKSGVMFPVNNRLSSADPSDGVLGLKGAFEAVQKGMFFGLEVDYAEMDTKDPITPARLAVPGTNLLGLHTEELLSSYDRFQFLATWDYDIVLPISNTMYDPILRPGLGLGLVAINPHEAPANTLTTFDNLYQFVGRPTLAIRFPVHKNIGLFVEGNYDSIPQSKLSGQVKPSRKTLDIGDKVEFSSGNLWFGLSFEF